MELEALGWNGSFEAAFAPFRAEGWQAARVAVEDKHAYLALTEQGEMSATVAGRLMHRTELLADLPKVGDWVAVAREGGEGPAVIQAVLPRQSRLSRKVPGREVEEQVLAANVHIAFIVQSLDQALNLRRQERFLMMVREGGVRGVIVLNKADLCQSSPSRLAEARRAAGDAPVLLASARTGRGLDELRGCIKPTQTVAFIGPSGVGKSSLINRLYGEEIQATIDVREHDGKGRHTTTWRELILLPCGGLVIDTPGMREVQMGMDGGALEDAFPDIGAIAVRCHFRDCSHTMEKRCAVLEAMTGGVINRERYDSFLKLKRELDYLAKERKKHTYLAARRKARLRRNLQGEQG